MSIKAFDGITVILSEERWHHIILRHPELEKAKSLIYDAIANPDEAYMDETGAVHALKNVGGISDFLVAIYSINGKGYIRTAYYTSNKRKTRRYKTFRKLKTS